MCNIVSVRVVSISACVQTHPSSIALRYAQRRILMSDPNWNKGRYYGKKFPSIGMQHARLDDDIEMCGGRFSLIIV